MSACASLNRLHVFKPCPHRHVKPNSCNPRARSTLAIQIRNPISCFCLIFSTHRDASLRTAPVHTIITYLVKKKRKNRKKENNMFVLLLPVMLFILNEPLAWALSSRFAEPLHDTVDRHLNSGMFIPGKLHRTIFPDGTVHFEKFSQTNTHGATDILPLSRVIGGSLAPSSTYNSLVIVFTELKGGIRVCTGTVLTKRRFLTALSCVRALTGRVYVSRQEDLQNGFGFSVSRGAVLNKTNRRTFMPDLLILETLFSVPSVNPVALPPTGAWKPKVGTLMYVAGYGRSSNSGSVSSAAREVRLKYRRTSACTKYISTDFRIFFTSKRYLCVTDPKFPKKASKGPCNEDTGGPLFLKRKKKILQLGIGSRFIGFQCVQPGSTYWYVNLMTYGPYIRAFLNHNYTDWTRSLY